ncbi:hypothetical protein GDO78_022571 [Eleutherodactylus coqui]|uniref:Uncharacterized protein n=1 Tax=Eleutherodactylus coqui TaxID=57060 RepID=A0A8J6B8L8_ELECQ|nr:hypothetical protein GDO78_022571 [Eleutherodactylus coqui]
MSILTLKIFRGFSTTASNVRTQSAAALHNVSLSILSAIYRFPLSRFMLKYFLDTSDTIRIFLLERSLTSNSRSFAKSPTIDPFLNSSLIE